ncbi:glycosyltransferase family 2 protein [Sinirhodobacter sp. WL0062]|uniref:Glycosyltransferase family 2 protein n=1 Tax=Rhodobacter flavimaris TaxID=2907145 RepID=A0ABS8YRQ9_9RHOB|nr:glycosyltransferase [Sinirhodobacter sp. WL0062]MCE5972564.1 glycosyltransferase family 2 protein [Sinirhodobacter sp. WL0062]
MTLLAFPEENLEQDIARRVTELNREFASGVPKWRLRDIVALGLILGFCVLGFLYQWNSGYDPRQHGLLPILGALGLWRYGWWFNHARRARKFGHHKWPEMRERRDEVWNSGWRPGHLHIQMTTFFEEPAITRHVMRALFDQIREAGLTATIYVGTGGRQDEEIIEEIAFEEAPDLDAQIVFVRQNQPGKRMAIGLVMRAIMRVAPEDDDVIVFMDGDTIFAPNALARSCAMFGADPGLDALTTNEEAIVYGPGWFRRLLNLRFAQRRLAMQSHVMSDKVLTLTGRMSMFRAGAITNIEFIRTIEADHLDHWLWGRFRFLSGDDKSTWYYMLKRRSKMAYVPDAYVYTVEIIQGTGVRRMVQNLRRWSGNMLRNGSRALSLGPRRVGMFIWWCVLDQKLAIWTTLVSPALLLLAVFLEPRFLMPAILWVISSRLVLSVYLFRYARNADMTWPFLLYGNQLVNALVKSYMTFFPQNQAWANRGGQRAGGGEGWIQRAKSAFALFQYVTAMLVFLFMTAWIVGSSETFGAF